MLIQCFHVHEHTTSGDTCSTTNYSVIVLCLRKSSTYNQFACSCTPFFLVGYLRTEYNSKALAADTVGGTGGLATIEHSWVSMVLSFFLRGSFGEPVCGKSSFPGVFDPPDSPWSRFAHPPPPVTRFAFVCCVAKPAMIIQRRQRTGNTISLLTVILGGPAPPSLGFADNRPCAAFFFWGRAGPSA
jgi:hypothetical protein